MRARIGLAAACWALALMLGGPAVGGAEIGTEIGADILDSKFELFVTDAAESIRFYEVVGFSVVHAKPDGYSTIRSGRTVMALSPVPWWLPLRVVGVLRHPPIGTEIVLYTGRLDDLRERLVAAGHSPSPVVLQPWGDRDFRITDPDGYYVRLSEGAAVPQ